MSIRPEAGMPVVYRPHAQDAFSSGPSCALAATITYVWSEAMVNLQVLDMYGQAHHVSSVQLCQELEQRPGLGRWCEFPLWFRMVMAPRKCARCEPFGPDPLATGMTSGPIDLFANGGY